MTQNDKDLIEDAMRVSYKEHEKVDQMIDKADSYECRLRLRKIRDALFDKRTGGRWFST